MMKNRTIALILILLAYSTILVHAIVPHHHHQYEMYLVSGEFKHLPGECTTSNEHDHQQKDEHQNEQSCELQLPIVVPANEDDHSQVTSVKDHSTHLFCLFADNHLNALSVPDFDKNSKLPYFLPEWFRVETNSLRGPPVA